jgi:hypothetical protein
VLNLPSGRLAPGDQDDLFATIGYHTKRWAVTHFGTKLTHERYEVPIVRGGSNTGAALFIVGNVKTSRHQDIETLLGRAHLQLLVCSQQCKETLLVPGFCWVFGMLLSQ